MESHFDIGGNAGPDALTELVRELVRSGHHSAATLNDTALGNLMEAALDVNGALESLAQATAQTPPDKHIDETRIRMSVSSAYELQARPVAAVALGNAMLRLLDVYLRPIVDEAFERESERLAEARHDAEGVL